MAKIGEKIRLARVQKGMTQEELAHKMWYRDRSAVNKVEKGVVDVYQRNIARYAEILDVPISFLMGWDEEGDKTTLISSCLEQLNDRGQRKARKCTTPSAFCFGRYIATTYFRRIRQKT